MANPTEPVFINRSNHPVIVTGPEGGQDVQVYPYSLKGTRAAPSNAVFEVRGEWYRQHAMSRNAPLSPFRADAEGVDGNHATRPVPVLLPRADAPPASHPIPVLAESSLPPVPRDDDETDEDPTEEFEDDGSTAAATGTADAPPGNDLGVDAGSEATSPPHAVKPVEKAAPKPRTIPKLNPTGRRNGGR
jgi:hypothetical protein